MKRFADVENVKLPLLKPGDPNLNAGLIEATRLVSSLRDRLKAAQDFAPAEKHSLLSEAQRMREMLEDITTLLG